MLEVVDGLVFFCCLNIRHWHNQSGDMTEIKDCPMLPQDQEFGTAQHPLLHSCNYKPQKRCQAASPRYHPEIAVKTVEILMLRIRAHQNLQIHHLFHIICFRFGLQPFSVVYFPELRWHFNTKSTKVPSRTHFHWMCSSWSEAPVTTDAQVDVRAGTRQNWPRARVKEDFVWPEAEIKADLGKCYQDTNW